MSGPPTKYTRADNFTAFSTNNPDQQQPGVSLDNEFDRIKTATDQTIDRLALLQRADGSLANQIVTPDSLAASTLTLISAVGLTPRGAWVTLTAYVAKDIVTNAGGIYICVVPHAAGASFAVDLAAGKWMILSNAPPNQSVDVGAAPSFNGIVFPSTQVASAGANTLDDYEEGTFTPFFTTDGGGTFSHIKQVGRYTKIGNMVSARAYARIVAATGGSGTMYFGGLPLTSANVSDAYSGGGMYLKGAGNIDNPNWLLSPNATRLSLRKYQSGSDLGIGWLDITDTLEMAVQLTYEAQ